MDALAISFNHDNSIEQDDERFLWQGKFSARSMIGVWIGSALITALVICAVLLIQPMRENRMVWLTMFGLICLIWIGLIGLVLYRKLSQHFEVTSQRLKHRSGVVFRQVDRIEMIDIDDVSYRQGPIQALLDVGTIQLSSSDTSHPQLVMCGIANVSSVANLIDDARRAERSKRGIHVESI